ncbi:MAG: serine/threonine protein kinase [Planctomycetota bacterium]|nr:MAG: serine/threonine protein kinase [Planctomycetota bacterium]
MRALRVKVAWLAIAIAVWPAGGRSASAAEWLQFRGPSGQGLVEEALPLRWGEGHGIAWKTPLPGRGWSSPVVSGDRIWLTTAEERPADEAERRKMLDAVKDVPVAGDMSAVASVVLAALEVDLASGKLLRQVKLFEIDAPPAIHGHNSYASPTPVIVGDRVFCHFGTFGTACVEMPTGAVAWRRRLEIDHIVGPGSSPAAFGNLLIVPCDGSDRQFIAALDLQTGDVVWQRERPPIRQADPDQRKAFSTPLVIHAGGLPQAVIPGAQWFVAYHPATGEEVWRVDHDSGFSNVPRPVFDGERLFLCTGFGKRGLWAVQPDGRGDVTASHVQWRQDQHAPTTSSPVVSDGRLYLVADGGVLSCLATDSGRLLWRKRLGGAYSASPLVGQGRVYLFSQEGLTTVLADAAQYQVLAENQLDGMLMASPAVADGTVIVRSDTHLYRVAGVAAPGEVGAGGLPAEAARP